MSESEWPTEQEAATKLKTSVKTITRYAEKGKIEMRKRPRAGRKPENICNPADIEQLMPRAHVMPPESVAIAHTTNVHGRALSPWEAALQTIATILTGRENVQTPVKLWLTLDEAAAYSGLPRSYIADLAAEGHVTAVKRRSWYICRKSLEEFGAAIDKAREAHA